MGTCPRITCTQVYILWLMDRNTLFSSFNSTSMFIRMAKFTEAITISIVSIRTVLGQAMAGRQAMVPRAQFAEGSAEPATSATNSEQNATGKVLALIASVSPRLRICRMLLMIRRIWLGLRVHTGTQEARQGFAQRSGTTSCSCSSQWSKITSGSFIR